MNEANAQNLVDLVAVTVGDIRQGGFSGDVPADDVVLGGDNIMIGPVPVAIADIMICKNSVKAFINLIRKAMK